MNLPAPAPPDLGALVEDFMAREERRLATMRDEGASWFTRLKQRRKIAQAQRTLEWADTRLKGETRFMWRHGLEAGLAIAVASEIGYWRIPWTTGHHDDIVAAVLLGLVFGGFGGWFAAVMEWNRRETSFTETLAKLLPKPQA